MAQQHKIARSSKIYPQIDFINKIYYLFILYKP